MTRPHSCERLHHHVTTRKCPFSAARAYAKPPAYLSGCIGFTVGFERIQRPRIDTAIIIYVRMFRLSESSVSDKKRLSRTRDRTPRLPPSFIIGIVLRLRHCYQPAVAEMPHVCWRVVFFFYSIYVQSSFHARHSTVFSAGARSDRVRSKIRAYARNCAQFVHALRKDLIIACNSGKLHV